MNISIEYFSINSFLESDDVSPPSPEARNGSGASDQTIVYINLDPEDTDYDMSDDEPLAKYRTKSEQISTEEGKDKTDSDLCRG